MLNHLNVIYLFIHYNSLILNYIFFNIYWAFFIYFINFRPQYAAIADYFIEYYNVSVKSINFVCVCTNKRFTLIYTSNTENRIKRCKYAILYKFEVFENCMNRIVIEQSGYISKWQNLLLTHHIIITIFIIDIFTIINIIITLKLYWTQKKRKRLQSRHLFFLCH